MSFGQVPLDGFRGGSAGELFRSRAIEQALDGADGVTAEHGERIMCALAERGEAESEEIADEMGVKQKHVRRALEDLYERRAVSRRRIEDSETGWISYHWRLEPERLLRRVRKEKRELLRKTREEVRRERKTVFFACEDSCSRIGYGRAMELGFECPDCGGELNESDSTPIIRDLKERVERLGRELERDQDPVER